MLPVDFLNSARSDYDSSFDWYADQDPEVSLHFLREVEISLMRIAKHPHQFPRVDERHRQCLVKGFPFQIIYRATESAVIVVAVAHTKRAPDYWIRREKL